jgi:hypothetical protein
MINVNQITSQLAKMPDPALQQYAAMHKNDPYTVALALAESNRRKQMRTGAQMDPGQQPKVVDQEIASIVAPQQQMLPEDTGIAQLPAQNIQGMAGGGIVAFDEGGEVPRFQNRGQVEDPFKNVSRDLKEMVLAAAAKYDIDPDIAMRLVQQESKFDPTVTSKKGAVGLTQLMPDASKEMGLDPDERTNPAKNVDAGFGYLRKQLNKYGNDYSKALSAYNWGGGNVDKHLEKNEGKISPVGLPKETANYLTKILPMGAAEAATKQEAPKDTTKAAPTQDRAWYDRYRDLMTSGQGQRAMLQGVQDVPAALLGAPVDIATAAMRPFGYKNEAPIMGSKFLKEKLTNMGLREADSANPDLQTIRSGTEGIASLYSPVKTGVTQPRSAIAGDAARQEAIAAEARAAVANPRLAGPTTSTTMAQKPGYAPVVNSPAKALEVADKERAIAETERAALLAKEAVAAKAPSLYSPGVNRVGAMGTASAAAPGVASLLSSDQAAPLTMGDDTFNPDVTRVPTPDGLDKKTLPESAAAAKGGIGDLFKDPMLQMGLQLMASQNPRFLSGVGEAGIATAGMQAAQRKDEAEQAYKAALAKNYGVDPLLQRLNALQDPKTAAAYAKMKEMDREPVTKAALFKEFLASPAGMAVSMKPDEIGPAFSNYVKSYESVMGPLGGTGAGFKVLGSRPG